MSFLNDILLLAFQFNLVNQRLHSLFISSHDQQPIQIMLVLIHYNAGVKLEFGSRLLDGGDIGFGEDVYGGFGRVVEFVDEDLALFCAHGTCQWSGVGCGCISGANGGFLFLE